MSAQAVLEKAACQGIVLCVPNGRVRGRGTKPDPAFLAEVREHEAELVVLLTESARAATSKPITSAQDTTTIGKPESHLIALEGRMAMGRVPSCYRDAWVQFQCRCPAGVTEQAWRQAINDAGRFLDKWGNSLPLSAGRQTIISTFPETGTRDSFGGSGGGK